MRRGKREGIGVLKIHFQHPSNTPPTTPSSVPPDSPKTEFGASRKRRRRRVTTPQTY
jgi:hypothetical protein